MPLLSKPLASEPWKVPSREVIRQKTFEAFGFYPCLWQIRVVEAILKHNRDVISIAATGSGKTLTFWMPLLFHKGGIQMVVTPLNLLGTLNVDDLASKGFTAIAISAENATKKNFKVNTLGFIQSESKRFIMYL
jgi:ATP-dependent DNA helicase RecQ